VLAEFPVDAARYWAAGTSIGDDFPYKEGDLEADLAVGETAMEVVSALRRYKTERGLALNADLGTVEVFGRVTGFEDAIAETMHVERLERRADDPEITTEIAGVDLDYSVVGPEFGAAVDDIDAAIEAGEFEVDGDRLVVADEYELESVRSVEGGEYATVDCRYETWFLLRPGTLLVPAHLIGELAAALRACDVAVPGWRGDAEPATRGSTFARLRLAVLLVALVAGPVVAVLG